MMLEQKIKPEAIGSDLVGFDHPYCMKHQRKHKIYCTQPKWIGTVLEVTRYHHCKECKAEGEKDPPPLINSRDFNFHTTG